MKTLKQLSIPAVGSVLVTLSNAISVSAVTVTYTDRATFLNNTSSTYLENFDSFSDGFVSNQQAFSSNGFTYSVSATDGLYSGEGNTGSRFLGTVTDNRVIDINFTSGNVTAIGGDFFLTDVDDFLTSGAVTLTLDDGTIINLTSPTSPPTPFAGFTSVGTAIASLTFAAPGGDNFANLDNLYVGTATAVPFEFSPTLGILILGGCGAGQTHLMKENHF